jgi:hypothetical protein
MLQNGSEKVHNQKMNRTQKAASVIFTLGVMMSDSASSKLRWQDHGNEEIRAIPMMNRSTLRTPK